uniref:Uncharacterized protein n=1 Tax=Romanomermis culicivorax TaxID=13658 RepID=A0A915KML4_ROMCU
MYNQRDGSIRLWGEYGGTVKIGYRLLAPPQPEESLTSPPFEDLSFSLGCVLRYPEVPVALCTGTKKTVHRDEEKDQQGSENLGGAQLYGNKEVECWLLGSKDSVHLQQDILMEVGVFKAKVLQNMFKKFNDCSLRIYLNL